MKVCMVELKSMSDGSYINMKRLLELLNDGWKMVLQTPPAPIFFEGIATNRVAFSVVLSKKEDEDIDIVDLEKLRNSMSQPLDINDLD